MHSPSCPKQETLINTITLNTWLLVIRNAANGEVRVFLFCLFFVLGLKANMLIDKRDEHHLCVFAAILSLKTLNKKAKTDICNRRTLK